MATTNLSNIQGPRSQLLGISSRGAAVTMAAPAVREPRVRLPSLDGECVFGARAVSSARVFEDGAPMAHPSIFPLPSLCALSFCRPAPLVFFLVCCFILGLSSSGSVSTGFAAVLFLPLITNNITHGSATTTTLLHSTWTDLLSIFMSTRGSPRNWLVVWGVAPWARNPQRCPLPTSNCLDYVSSFGVAPFSKLRLSYGVPAGRFEFQPERTSESCGTQRVSRYSLDNPGGLGDGLACSINVWAGGFPGDGVNLFRSDLLACFGVAGW